MQYVINLKKSYLFLTCFLFIKAHGNTYGGCIQHAISAWSTLYDRYDQTALQSSENIALIGHLSFVTHHLAKTVTQNNLIPLLQEDLPFWYHVLQKIDGHPLLQGNDHGYLVIINDMLGAWQKILNRIAESSALE